jgi:hypothetical protein
LILPTRKREMRGVGLSRREIYGFIGEANLHLWGLPIFDKLDRDFTKVGSGGWFGFKAGWVEWLKKTRWLP